MKLITALVLATAVSLSYAGGEEKDVKVGGKTYEVRVPKSAKTDCKDKKNADKTECKKDPKAMPIVGSTAGGVDNYLAAQLFDALGLSIKDLNYTPAPTVSAVILSDAKYAFAISSSSEFSKFEQAGTLRILATSAPKAVKGIKAPTLVSKNVNVVVENWRGIMVPPKTPATARALVIRALDVANASKSYKAYLAANNAFSNWLPGNKFTTFLKKTENDLRRIYADIGLL
jgi:putative tricarboxylic transport membrane protein